MVNMFSTQDFRLKVTFLIRVGAEVPRLTPFSQLSHNIGVYASLARQSSIYKTSLGGHFIP